MLLSKFVEVTMSGTNCSYYKKRGYRGIWRTKERVAVSDLSPQSTCRVLVKCDGCGKESWIPFQTHNRYGDGKDYCQQCKYIRSMQTNRKKYGCDNPFQNKEIQEKQKKTVIKKYGCENVFQNEEVKNKIKLYFIDKYGEENPMQCEEIKKKSQNKQRESMNKNGTQQCSSQQKYIAEAIGVKVNFLFYNCWLDGFDEKEKIYFEYNGSGHDIDVKYHKTTKEEFQEKEIKRYKFLKTKGLKEVLFISKKDCIPDKNVIKQMWDFSKNILEKENTNFIEIDFDNKTVRTKNWQILYDDCDNNFTILNTL